MDLHREIKMNYAYFVREDATPEELETGQLLFDNGYRDEYKKLAEVFSSFLRGELGSDYNEYYCEVKNYPVLKESKSNV